MSTRDQLGDSQELTKAAKEKFQELYADGNLERAKQDLLDTSFFDDETAEQELRRVCKQFDIDFDKQFPSQG